MPNHVIIPCRPPYDWAALHRFLAERAVPGIEAVSAEGYRRTFALDGRCGVVAVGYAGGAMPALNVSARTSREDVSPLAIERVRRLFDCDADPAPIGERLSGDPLLAHLVARRPGLRVAGAWEGFELGVRAILGQQVSVGAATGLAGRLVATFGMPLPAGEGDARLGLTHLFPTPDALAEADISQALKMPRSRGAAIRTLARAVISEPDLLTPGQEIEAAVARLKALKGIGEWTAQYIAMRALKAPDAMPVGDIGLLRALDEGAGRPTPAALLARSQNWRPWRAYAVMHLWARHLSIAGMNRAGAADCGASGGVPA